MLLFHALLITCVYQEKWTCRDMTYFRSQKVKLTNVTSVPTPHRSCIPHRSFLRWFLWQRWHAGHGRRPPPTGLVRWEAGRPWRWYCTCPTCAPKIWPWKRQNFLRRAPPSVRRCRHSIPSESVTRSRPRDKQGVERHIVSSRCSWKVRGLRCVGDWVLQENDVDYVTYVSMFIHRPRSTTLVTVEGDVQVNYGRRAGYLSETY